MNTWWYTGSNLTTLFSYFTYTYQGCFTRSSYYVTNLESNSCIMFVRVEHFKLGSIWHNFNNFVVANRIYNSSKPQMKYQFVPLGSCCCFPIIKNPTKIWVPAMIVVNYNIHFLLLGLLLCFCKGVGRMGGTSFG